MTQNYHLPLLEMLEKVLGRTTSSGGTRADAKDLLLVCATSTPNDKLYFYPYRSGRGSYYVLSFVLEI